MQNRSKTFLKHRQNRSKTFLKHRQQTAKLPHNWSVVPVLPEFCSGATGVLFRHCRSFITAVRELVLLEVSKHHIIHHVGAYIVKIGQRVGLCQFDVAFLAEITGMLRRALSLLVS